METSEAVSREGGFNISRFVPPSGQTARAAAYSYSQSRGFQLALRRVGAAHLPQVRAGSDRADPHPEVTSKLWCHVFMETFLVWSR